MSLNVSTRLPLIGVLDLIPKLELKGGFLEWSRCLKQALDTQDTNYWSILIDGPIICPTDKEAASHSILLDLLTIIRPRIDLKLHSLLASVDTPRIAFKILKDYFTDTELHRDHPRYIQWIDCVYTPPMHPLYLIIDWYFVLKQLVELPGIAPFSFNIELHQFFVAVSASGSPAVEWTKSFEIDPTWPGNEMLKKVLLDFLRLEMRRLHTAV
ncbi:uncharacterized protein N7479_005923 [Penicillium vulpinum]|uniref:Uncharacterized protein n=1 Tax=Penicillium vulpinum TaxID=29845 RepID=A0A1V6SF04_9EURO|nr:uncharacterized protein N7479_005923 [Penicillium vulpinum]KAJ5958773.1 hypothetical protein N7479_005923 [Penicillium vulpinum]OQE12360.1 hypothetical protein PENVUL_c001G04477 [Penicillium vulpinum]